MAGRHPRGDLAPRDVVAAEMHRVMAAADPAAEHLWLDATGLGRAELESHFPTVTAACRAAGIEPSREPIPVAPGAHYACGGVRADMTGRTSVAGLYAVGEVAATGVHGANRLASNSLTEAIATGRRLGRLLGRRAAGTSRVRRRARRRARGSRAGRGRRGAGTGPGWPPPCPGTPGCCATAPGWSTCSPAGRRPARRLAWTWPRSRRPTCTRCRRWSPSPRWPGPRAAAATAGRDAETAPMWPPQRTAVALP